MLQIFYVKQGEEEIQYDPLPHIFFARMVYNTNADSEQDYENKEGKEQQRREKEQQWYS